jgi:hypothetical protein
MHLVRSMPSSPPAWTIISLCPLYLQRGASKQNHELYNDSSQTVLCVWYMNVSSTVRWHSFVCFQVHLKVDDSLNSDFMLHKNSPVVSVVFRRTPKVWSNFRKLKCFLLSLLLVLLSMYFLREGILQSIHFIRRSTDSLRLFSVSLGDFLTLTLSPKSVNLKMLKIHHVSEADC